MNSFKQRVSFVVVWIAIYSSRIVLLFLGIGMTRFGIAYLNQSYEGFALHSDGNSDMYRFPILSGNIKEVVIQSQFDGLLILGPFLGIIGICLGLVLITAAMFFRNFETVLMLVGVTIFQVPGPIVRQSIPDEFYTQNGKDNLNSSQVKGLIIGLVFSLVGIFGLSCGAILKLEVLAPTEHFVALVNKYINKDRSTKEKNYQKETIES